MLNFCAFIQVYVFNTNHHLKCVFYIFCNLQWIFLYPFFFGPTSLVCPISLSEAKSLTVMTLLLRAKLNSLGKSGVNGSGFV